MVKVRWNDLVGYADTNIAGYKFGNVMFYPDGGKPFYRRCVKFSECQEEK